MKKIMWVFIASLIFLYSFIVQSDSNVGKSYPQDIDSFIEKREQCDYLRGEISGEGNIDEMRDLNGQLDKYCKGSDQALIQLKLKYKNNIQVSKKLNGYDENIEPSE